MRGLRHRRPSETTAKAGPTCPSIMRFELFVLERSTSCTHILRSVSATAGQSAYDTHVSQTEVISEYCDTPFEGLCALVPFLVFDLYLAKRLAKSYAVRRTHQFPVTLTLTARFYLDSAYVKIDRASTTSATTTEYAMNYDHYELDDLKRFVSGRRLEVDMMGRPSTRRSYTRALRKADRRQKTFRFFDLPAELRNVIYAELLILRPSSRNQDRGYCWPNLLASCHQIFQEASGILYTDNPVQITFSLSVARRSRTRPNSAYAQCGISVNGKAVPWEGRKWSLMERSIEWPAFLMKLRRLRLRLKFEDAILPIPFHHGDGRPSAHLITINHALYDVYLHLRDSTALEQVHVFYDMIGPALPAETLKELIDPLTFFGPATIVSGVSDEVMKRFYQDQTRARDTEQLARDTVLRFRRLYADFSGLRLSQPQADVLRDKMLKETSLKDVWDDHTLITRAKLTELELYIEKVETFVAEHRREAVGCAATTDTLDL